MTRTPVQPRGGIAGLWLLFCAVAAAGGAALDFALTDAPAFWIGAQPGGAAALGVVAAVVVVIFARIGRWTLSRIARERMEGERNAVDLS